MGRQLLILTGLLCPLLAFGDTLLMKDGSRFNGRFISSNGQVINFAESNGNRQTVNSYDVRELRFGADEGQSFNGGRNQTEQNRTDGQPAVGTQGLGQSLDQLEGDLRMTVDNSQLQEDQRRSLRDSRETLRHAVQVSQSGQVPDRPALRQAIDSVRAAVNDPSVRPEDRDRVLGDLDRLRGIFPGMNDDRFGRGRNY